MTELTTTKIEKLDEWLDDQIERSRNYLRSIPGYPYVEENHKRGYLHAMLTAKAKLEDLRNDV